MWDKLLCVLCDIGFHCKHYVDSIDECKISMGVFCNKRSKKLRSIYDFKCCRCFKNIKVKGFWRKGIDNK